jgi:hypothetical protein
MPDGFGTTNNFVISSLATFDGHLYAVTRNLTSGSEVWRSSNGTVWNQVAWYGLGDPNNNLGYGFKVFQDHLYLVTGNRSTGAEVWRTPDGTTWYQVGFWGWGNPSNFGSYWDNGIAVLGDRLYVATLNPAGGEVWMYLHNTVYLPLSVKNH